MLQVFQYSVENVYLKVVSLVPGGGMLCILGGCYIQMH